MALIWWLMFIPSVLCALKQKKGDPLPRPGKPKSFQGKSYQYVQQPRETWEGALAACRLCGSTLASASTEQEYDFFISIVESEGGHIWVGGNRIHRPDCVQENETCTFEWVENGNLVGDFVWHPGEPNNVDGDEKCVEIGKFPDSEFGGDANDCYERFPYLCLNSKALVSFFPFLLPRLTLISIILNFAPLD